MEDLTDTILVIVVTVTVFICCIATLISSFYNRNIRRPREDTEDELIIQ
jgi:hypothetical protein